jgi:hypothetical protein
MITSALGGRTILTTLTGDLPFATASEVAASLLPLQRDLLAFVYMCVVQTVRLGASESVQ